MARPRFTRRRFVFAAATVGTVGQAPGAFLLRAALAARFPSSAWPIALGLCAAATAALGLRLALGLPRGERGAVGAALYLFYTWWAASMVAGASALPCWLVAHALGQPFSVAAVASLALGGIAAIAGVTVRRVYARLRHVEVRVRGLPPALDGYRIAQLSDLHVGWHTPPARVRSWVDRINALAPDLVAITGDLITTGDHFIDAACRELGRLRGRDGVALCMGNHDYFGDHHRLLDGLAREGIEVLRNRGRVVERAGACYWLAGVDDTWQRLDDVERALAGRPDGAPAIVLAHDPDLFDECAERGATLVLSGHTHGGQIALPVLSRTFNFARLRHRYTAGSYRRGDAHLYVSRGAGTTGPPLRIGAPSEIALITLRAA